MDDTTPNGCHKVGPEGSTGNIDKDGEVVGQVLRFKRLAPGMEAVPSFDLDEHLRRIAGEVRRSELALPNPRMLDGDPAAAWGQ